jgi:hypothetical protein
MSTFKRSRIAACMLGPLLCALPAMQAYSGVEAVAAAPMTSASRLEKIDGSELKRVILSQKASKRLDIRTSKTAQDAAGLMTAPYAALIYDGTGRTWVYTNPEPLVFVRAPVVVDSIQGPMAILKEGPPAGTTVVVSGVAELYGAESGVGK